MKNELLLLVKKHVDILFENTRRRPRETFELKKNKHMETFSFNPPINLVEEGKWLLGVTFFEATNSFFNLTDENNSSSISIPVRWRSPNYLEDGIIVKLKNDMGFHVQEFEKRCWI